MHSENYNPEAPNYGAYAPYLIKRDGSDIFFLIFSEVCFFVPSACDLLLANKKCWRGRDVPIDRWQMDHSILNAMLYTLAQVVDMMLFGIYTGLCSP